MSEVGLRVNEARHLDLADIKWDLGRFGKLHVRHGKGARGSGPRERMVPLINDAGRTLRWFVEDVWGQLGDDPARHGVPLFCSERNNADGTAARVGNEALRAGLAEAAAKHLPAWSDTLTPHVLRHFCASQLYFGGMDLNAARQLLHSYTPEPNTTTTTSCARTQGSNRPTAAERPWVPAEEPSVHLNSGQRPGPPQIPA